MNVRSIEISSKFANTAHRKEIVSFDLFDWL